MLLMMTTTKEMVQLRYRQKIQRARRMVVRERILDSWWNCGHVGVCEWYQSFVGLVEEGNGTACWLIIRKLDSTLPVLLELLCLQRVQELREPVLIQRD
jgi:hypothetical protein